jgi:hypothetical protein
VDDKQFPRAPVAPANAAGAPGPPRLFRLEDEYRATMRHAEIAWLRALIGELGDGTLRWDRTLIEETPARFG